MMHEFRGNQVGRKQINFADIIGIVLLGICGFLTAVSVYLCFSHDIWYDELFTVGLADSSFADLMKVASKDVHPPLYYLIVKFVLDIGKMIMGNPDTVVTAKIVSVLPFLLLLGYGVTKVRKHFGLLTAGIFCFLVYTMPQISQYMVEIRMYGFCLFFITAGLLHAYEIIQRGEGRRWYLDWVWVTLYLLGAAYSHYFAFVAAVMVYLYLFLWLIISKRPRQDWIAWGSSAGAAGVAYLPWLTVVLRQVGSVKENYWIQPLSWRSVGGCIKFLFKPAFTNDSLNTVIAVMMFVIFAAVVILAVGKGKWNLWGRMRQEPIAGEQLTSEANAGEQLTSEANAGEQLTSEANAREQITSEANAGGQIAKALGAGEQIIGELKPGGHDSGRWKQADREHTGGIQAAFLCACLGVLGGVVVFGFAASFLLRPIFIYRYMLPAMGAFWLAFAIALGMLIRKKQLFYVVLAFFLIVGMRNYRAFYGEEMWKRVQMKETEAVLAGIQPEDILIFNFNHTQGVTSYYLLNETFLYDSMPEELIVEMFPQVQGMNGEEEILRWLADGKQVWFLGSGNAREELREQWLESGIRTEEKANCLIERYWFNLYRVY